MDRFFQGLFGEKSLTKVAALYDDEISAKQMAGRIRRLPGMLDGQVRILSGDDLKTKNSDLFGKKMEPEQRGIFSTMLRTHVAGGTAGVILGLAIYAFFASSRHPMVASSPVLAFIAIVGFATTFGLMLGGLATIRPDHVRLIAKVRSALRKGRWALVVHPVDERQTKMAQELMDSSGATVVRTL